MARFGNTLGWSTRSWVVTRKQSWPSRKRRNSCLSLPFPGSISRRSIALWDARLLRPVSPPRRKRLLQAGRKSAERRDTYGHRLRRSIGALARPGKVDRSEHSFLHYPTRTIEHTKPVPSIPKSNPIRYLTALGLFLHNASSLPRRQSAQLSPPSHLNRVR